MGLGFHSKLLTNRFAKLIHHRPSIYKWAMHSKLFNNQRICIYIYKDIMNSLYICTVHKLKYILPRHLVVPTSCAGCRAGFPKSVANIEYPSLLSP